MIEHFLSSMQKYSMIKYFFLPFIYLSVGFSQTGREIAVMMDESPSPKDMSSQTTMILTNSKGKAKIRWFPRWLIIVKANYMVFRTKR